MQMLEVLHGVRARIIRKTGPSVSDTIIFEAESDDKLEGDTVALIQTKLGYHPAGYGGPSNIKGERTTDRYITSWYCYASCD